MFSILPQAQKFEAEDLETRCWGTVESHTEQALMSDEFLTLARSIVESVVKRYVLKVKEVDLFKSVDRLATKELKRPQGLERKILGGDNVKGIRFSLLLQKELALVVVLDCAILNKREIGDMIN